MASDKLEIPKSKSAATAPAHTHGRTTAGQGGNQVGYGATAVVAEGRKVVFERDPVELAQNINRLTKGAGLAYNTETGKAYPVAAPSGPRGYGGMKSDNAKNANIIVIGRDGPRDRKQHTAWKSAKEKDESFTTAIKLAENTPKEIVMDAAKVPNASNTQVQTQKRLLDNKWKNVPGVTTGPSIMSHGM